MRSRTLALILMFFAAAAFGCSSYDDSLDTPAEEAAADGDDGDGADGDGEHEHGDEGNERDAYSKPGEVYEFLEIGAGSRVIDLMAGGGYNAEALAYIVGSDGAVVAERAGEDFQGRVLGGDLASMGNISFVGDVAEIEDGSIDAVVAVRAYHLFPDVPATLAELHRALAPGGVVGIVEVRLNEAEGHNMETHRVGEQTVINDFEAAGFEYVGESDILRRDDDDYSVYMPEGGTRYTTDRMLLKFRKAE